MKNLEYFWSFFEKRQKNTRLGHEIIIFWTFLWFDRTKICRKIRGFRIWYQKYTFPSKNTFKTWFFVFVYIFHFEFIFHVSYFRNFYPVVCFDLWFWVKGQMARRHMRIWELGSSGSCRESAAARSSSAAKGAIEAWTLTRRRARGRRILVFSSEFI